MAEMLNQQVPTQYQVSLPVTIIDGILPKEPYPPCLRMAGRALLAGYTHHVGLTDLPEEYMMAVIKGAE